ncbi:MAG: hypothetical protein WA029_24435, partial [Anaerolineae bacterium]
MTVDELLAQMLTLSSADRRRLFRRAQRMGLLHLPDLEGGDAGETSPALVSTPAPAQPELMRAPMTDATLKAAPARAVTTAS